jgi:hypothetical protein
MGPESPCFRIMIHNYGDIFLCKDPSEKICRTTVTKYPEYDIV